MTRFVLFALSALAATPRIEVCHQGRVLSVAAPAAGGHTRHGDTLVAAEACYDGVDNDCDGLVDEDCPTCPCFDYADLLEWFDADDACFDYDIGTYETRLRSTYLADFTGEGLAAGAGDNWFYPANFCAVIDLTNTGLIEWGITPDEYAGCEEIVRDAADAIGIECSDVPPAHE